MSNLNQNGFSFLRLLPNGILVLLLFAAFLTFVNPVYTNAGAFQDTDQVFKDISDGKLNTGAQEWIKKSNSEEDYEWMKEYFGEDNANKFYNNEKFIYLFNEWKKTKNKYIKPSLDHIQP